RVWMNPPYAAELVDKFVGKLCGHFEAGEVQTALLLVNNATETKWLQQAAKVSSAICFPTGRVRFLDPNGGEGAPLQGQAVLYMGEATSRFIQEFEHFGFCFVRPAAGLKEGLGR